MAGRRPGARRRSLARNPEHDYPETADERGVYRCTRCGKPTREPEADTSWCNGLRQSRLGGRSNPHRDDPEVYGSYHAWVGGLRCLVRDHPRHRCAGGTAGHHVRTVGAGGKDWGNEVPLCERAHREVHRIGRESFASRYDVNLEEAAWSLRTRAPEEVAPGFAPDEGAERRNRKEGESDR